MRMTPLEIHTHRFGRRFSGIDADEVEAFLRMVAEDYESVLQENEGYRTRIHHLEKQVEKLAEQEQLLKETLLSAQSMSEDMRQTAVKESEVLLGEAEVRAEKIIDAAHRRAAHIGERIRELKGMRAGLAQALRATMDTHLHLLDQLANDSGPEGEGLVDGIVDGKVAVLGSSGRNPSGESGNRT